MIPKNRLGRTFHFACGSILGAVLFGISGWGLGLRFRWPVAGMITFGVAGTLLFGYLAMRYQDFFWAWFGGNNPRWR